jgi:glutamyl-tRNA synthetase
MALFDYACARQQGGAFVLRIEDTDRARYNEASEQRIFAALHWLGLQWDEGPNVGAPMDPTGSQSACRCTPRIASS